MSSCAADDVVYGKPIRDDLRDDGEKKRSFLFLGHYEFSKEFGCSNLGHEREALLFWKGDVCYSALHQLP